MAFDPDNPLVLDPGTGQVLALNHGAATGLHRSPVALTVTPIVVQAPAFVTIPTQIGGVVAVSPGVWFPSSAVVVTQIGTGLTEATFVAYIDGTSGTIPAEMADLPLTARVQASLDLGVTSVAVFLDAGVTIEDEEVDPGFPTDISDAHWDVAEVTEGVEGAVTLTLSASISYDTGAYALLWSSGSTNLGLPRVDDPKGPVTAGNSYTTPTGFPVGSTVHNSLAWWRLSDNAIQRAHGPNPNTATDQQVSLTIEGFDDPPPPPGSDPTFAPDVTVGSIGAVRSQIQAWIANWNGTVPSGKTASDDRVIGVNASTSGTFDLQNLVNAQATRTSRRIFVRAVGTYTNENCSVKHTGAFRLNGSRGIWAALMHIRCGGSFSDEASNLCGAIRCIIESAAPSETVAPASDYVATIKLSANFTIAHCLLRYGDQAPLLFWDVTGVHCYGNMFDYTPCDDMKVFWRFDGGRVERNWGARRHCPGKLAATSGTPHADFWQNQGFYEQNSLFWGNVDLIKPGQLHPGSAYSRSRQVFFHKRESGGDTRQHYTGTRWEQNLSFSQLGQLLQDRAALSAGQAARYNTAICAGGPANNNGAIIQALAPRDFNFVTTVGAQATSDAAAGPNGVGLVIGHRDSAGVNYRYYDDLVNWFQFGIPWQNAAGSAVPFAQQTLKAFLPKTGTRLHWNHNDPCGAYLRMREIFDVSYRATASAAAGYNVIPHAWPVLSVWHARYNGDDYVADDYTGSYDSNGDPA